MPEQRSRPEIPQRPEAEIQTDMFDAAVPGKTIIKIREIGTDTIISSYRIEGIGQWRERESEILQRKFILSSDGKSRTIIAVRDQKNGKFWVEDTDGNRLEVISCSTENKEESIRSVTEMRAIMDSREANKQTVAILDEEGNALCDLDRDVETSAVIGIRPHPYENIDQSAEKPAEHIYLTAGNGEIRGERATRGEARDRDERYLVVTTLIFHGNRILIQQRSEEKKIDPDKMSSSSHGVAKEIYLDGKRVEDVDIVSIINTALEINEELRHGKEVEPFRCVIWPGTKDELFGYADAENINDPNTVYLVLENLYAEGGYPLGDKDQQRTRALSTGFIFSQETTKISYDPAEVSDVKWMKMSEHVDDSTMTSDVQRCIDDLVDRHLATTSRDVSSMMAIRALRDEFEGMG